MKKIIKLLFLTASVSALMGCNDDSNQAKESSSGIIENPITHPEAPSIPKPIKPQTLKLIDYTPGSIKGGSSDASTAVALDSNFIIVGDDEANVLRVYPKTGGDAVASWDFEVTGPMLEKELDIEASALLPNNVVIFTGSHGNKKNGGDASEERSHMFTVKITGTGAATTFEYLGKYSNLESDLIDWDISNQHKKGANYYGLAASATDGAAPERVDGFAIEGMTLSQDGKSLLLGFRAPQQNLVARKDALIISVTNYEDLIFGRAKKANISTAYELNLGGRGIRSLAKAQPGEYLIVAGPALANRTEVADAFELYLWNGKAESSPLRVNENLQQLREASAGSIETIVEKYLPNQEVHLLLDNGDSVWPNQTSISKDLDDKDQRFQGSIFQLGAVVADTNAPLLVKTTPENSTVGVNTDAQIQLWFKEGIRLNDKVIRLYQGNELVESFNAQSTQVKVDFNRLVLTPSKRLKYETDYRIEMDNVVQDHFGNVVAAAKIAQFKTAGVPTPLQAGDLYFVAGNAEAPDAIAFMLMKDIDGGTEIYFTDRDYFAENKSFWHRGKNEPASNEGVFRWTADRFLKAGSIITIQTDTEASPIANVGQVLGAASGIGKEDAMYTLVNMKVDNLQDGSAGLITQTGDFLAAITLGGVTDNDIPLEIQNYHMAFLPQGKADQTNAIFDINACGSNRNDLVAMKRSIMMPSCWTMTFKSQGAAGYPMLENNSLFKNAILK